LQHITFFTNRTSGVVPQTSLTVIIIAVRDATTFSRVPMVGTLALLAARAVNASQAVGETRIASTAGDVIAGITGAALAGALASGTVLLGAGALRARIGIKIAPGRTLQTALRLLITARAADDPAR
jgi:hypothetical protein